jgi:hypothetical protein
MRPAAALAIAGESALRRDHLSGAEILGALQNVPDDVHADRLINQNRSWRPIFDYRLGRPIGRQRQHKAHNNDGEGDKRARGAAQQETESNEDQGHDQKLTAAHQVPP